MPARREPTKDEAIRIHAVLRLVRADPHNVHWSTLEAKREAFALSKAIGGYKPDSANCISCNIKVLNILHEAVNLPPVSPQAPHALHEQRMGICKACPAFHPSTESCGRLITDALSPQPVTIDGKTIQPCGCYLPIKTRFKASKCPASKW